MSFSLNLQPEAEEDLDRSIYWYESKRRGLGLQFLEDVETAKSRIIEHPYRRVVHGGLRRYSLAQFQHGVFYLIEEKSRIIQILAIFHNRENPEKWSDRYEEWLDG